MTSRTCQSTCLWITSCNLFPRKKTDVAVSLANKHLGNVMILGIMMSFPMFTRILFHFLVRAAAWSKVLMTSFHLSAMISFKDSVTWMNRKWSCLWLLQNSLGPGSLLIVQTMIKAIEMNRVHVRDDIFVKLPEAFLCPFNSWDSPRNESFMTTNCCNTVEAPR